MRKSTRISIFVLIAVAVAAVLWMSSYRASVPVSFPVQEINTIFPAPATSSASGISPMRAPPAGLAFPLNAPTQRITKKFLGTYVTPSDSPVNPERFTGYHTGLDFETFLEEQNTDVLVHAICTGPLVLKKMASGYGGVAVQQCAIDDQMATVVYGHVRLSSVKAGANEILRAGDVLGILGAGYSTETDGERKHLHLGIHKGSAVNIFGYVQNARSLSAWLDPQKVLGL